MSANISGRMIYSFEKPMWHSITEPSLEPLTADEILLGKWNGGFTTELRPVTVTLNGFAQETGDFAIVRSPMVHDPKEVVFGFCTERYNPLQPYQITEVFDRCVNKRVETMAFLGNGNDMFISWQMPEIEVVKGDVAQMYGIVRTGFDSLKGTHLFTSTYRPVCSNTITLAQNWAKRNTDGKGKGEIWNSKHVNKNLLRDLGYWMEHVTENAEREVGLIESFFKKLAATPVKSDAHVKALLLEAYPDANPVPEYYPVQLRGAKETAVADENEKSLSVRGGIFDLFAGKGTGITPDLWGCLNSMSEYFCHVLPSKKPIASSVMFGNRATQMRKFIDVLKEQV